MQEYGTATHTPSPGLFNPVVVGSSEKKPLLSRTNGTESVSPTNAGSTQRTWTDRIRRRMLFWKDKFVGMLFNPCFYIVALIVASFAVAGWYLGRIFFQRTTEAKSWFLENSPYSILWYYGLFVCGTALLLPYGPFCLAVGYIFGVGEGCIIQIGAVFASSTICFSLGRHVFKNAVERWLGSQPVWMTMLKLIAKDWREAAKLNLLISFMPFPYGAHIFLFAISEVPFEQFIVFAMMGMMPYTFLELLAGHALSDAEHAKATHIFRYIGTATAMVALLLAVCYAADLAQEVLEEAQRHEVSPEKPTAEAQPEA